MADARTTIKKPKPRIARMLKISLSVLLCVIAAHGAWAWHANRALDRRVQLLRAAGERILPADFDTRVSDANLYENAARDLKAAAAIANDDSDEAATASWVSSTRPSNPKAWPYLERAKAWFEPAVRRIERAQAKPFCDWDREVRSPVLHMLLPELNGLRDLSNVLVVTALVELRNGRDDLAVRRFGQMLYLADTCAPTPAPVAHAVALSIQVNAAACLEQVAPELRIGAAVGPAPADEVRKLIASLLDESAAARGFETSVQAARMGALDMMQSLAHGTNVSPVARFVAGPMVDRESLPMLEHETRVVDAVRHATDWPTTAERLAAIAPLTDGALPTSSLGSGNIVRRLARTHFATLTDRRLAATALAIRLYQLDHGGARPQRLDVLVPAYLPAVPLDAMAAGGQPIRYLPRADHPVLYSVGGNGADDAGDESPMPNEYGDIDEHRRLDRVFYLSGRQRAYIYIARPLPSDGSMLGADAGIADAPPPWERDEAAAAATQPAFTPR